MRTWNLICLCQLQYILQMERPIAAFHPVGTGLLLTRFSVGAGRPPVIAKQYLDQCAKILEFPSYNFRDELVLAGVELYHTLWDLTSSNVIQKKSATWPEIDKLRKTHDHIYKLDSSEPLRFAYSCTYLILARRTLQHLNYTLTSASKVLDKITQKLPFIEEAIFQSHQLLIFFLSMSDLTTYIHPAYNKPTCALSPWSLWLSLCLVSLT
ncbi:uncharacterized protein N7477_009746 [Penicillium maclennaniae]|uniref:uncharacterized protein n=1 Tax=Penicillium maclennaniae TaxID=1343394 RepID=UPI002542179F|nr:uncharacterized protein N7477_009746 [Penicillium maclennaniae]KAJ5662130.1 hypothetical protein N7477_009746 [Penicillium maclennaniae]